MDGSLRRGREHNNSFFSREEISWAACGNVVTSHLLHNKGRGLATKGGVATKAGSGVGLNAQLQVDGAIHCYDKIFDGAILKISSSKSIKGAKHSSDYQYYHHQYLREEGSF